MDLNLMSQGMTLRNATPALRPFASGLNWSSSSPTDGLLPLCQELCPVMQSSDLTYVAYSRFVTTILIPLVGVFGLTGNSLSAFVYSRRALRRNSVNIYLCALAFSDCMVILTALFMFFIDSIRRHDLLLAKIFARGSPLMFPLGMMAQTCSVYFTVAAGIDCFVSVLFSKRFRHCYCNGFVALLVIGCLVVFGFVYNVPHYFEVRWADCFDAAHNASSLTVCPTELRMDLDYITIYYTYSYTIFMAVGPLLLLILLNSAIVTKTVIMSKRRRRQPPASHQRPPLTTSLSVASAAEVEMDSGDTITLILVVCLFIFCNSLALIVNFLELLYAEQLEFMLNYLVDASNLLVVANSSANILIYYAFGVSFRRQLLHSLRCTKTATNHTGSGHHDAPGNNGVVAPIPCEEKNGAVDATSPSVVPPSYQTVVGAKTPSSLTGRTIISYESTL